MHQIGNAQIWATFLVRGQRGSQIDLRVKIYCQYPLTLLYKGISQMLAGHCFSNAAFLIGDGNNLAHITLPLSTNWSMVISQQLR
ncbi:hypothetical protein SDC9_204394 [bioreactor metagenome]|uniref:Uncharacterized protein n=1 Tax=bioreactor metagenome TaxID=1076179 RepID=A0A645JB20_9ZZZZ